jgi:hypothetical protein
MAAPGDPAAPLRRGPEKIQQTSTVPRPVWRGGQDGGEDRRRGDAARQVGGGGGTGEEGRGDAGEQEGLWLLRVTRPRRCGAGRKKFSKPRRCRGRCGAAVIGT